MKELPHQELRNQYFEEKKTDDKAWKDWEWKDDYLEDWRILTKDPEFRLHHQYRRKPRFIEINGFQVPEPYRGKMKIGQEYFTPEPRSDCFCENYIWDGGIHDTTVSKCGLLHLYQEAASIHGKALASFTNPELKP